MAAPGQLVQKLSAMEALPARPVPPPAASRRPGRAATRGAALLHRAGTPPGTAPRTCMTNPSPAFFISKGADRNYFRAGKPQETAARLLCQPSSASCPRAAPGGTGQRSLPQP